MEHVAHRGAPRRPTGGLRVRPAAELARALLLPLVLPAPREAHERGVSRFQHVLGDLLEAAVGLLAPHGVADLVAILCALPLEEAAVAHADAGVLVEDLLAGLQALPAPFLVRLPPAVSHVASVLVRPVLGAGPCALLLDEEVGVIENPAAGRRAGLDVLVVHAHLVALPLVEAAVPR